jgi:hypothetical protein
MINPDIKGAAAFMHGYVALCGFGITLIRNQIVDATPIARNEILRNVLFLIDVILFRTILMTLFIPYRYLNGAI